jgi:GT2 family glycosyltransferase
MADGRVDARLGVAVLMACHNRRDMTLACLRSLFGQSNLQARLRVFLVDDGSSDGTADAVTSEFPHVEILQGTGELYWGGAMRLAFQAASNYDFDFHLWLNDDVVLDDGAIDILLLTHAGLKSSRLVPTIVAGAVRDPITKTTSYSGVRHSSTWHRLRFRDVEPGPLPKLCDTMSGNVVLVPRDAFERLGPIDKAFIHWIGDWDYGLRLTKSGGEVWLAPAHVGTCRNEVASAAHAAPGFSNLREFISIKRHPLRPYFIYVRRHGGYLWPILFVGPYLNSLRKSLPFLHGHSGIAQTVRPR